MHYELYYSINAVKQLDKLDNSVSAMITRWMDKNINGCSDPRIYGKQLRGNLKEYWRYRVGDFRILCVIHDDKMIVVAVNVGNRRNVYKRPN